MKVTFINNGETWEVETDSAVDISIPVTPENGVKAWGVGPAEIYPHRDGDLIGSVASGAAVNFYDIGFNPHAHGTHTECLGHITRELHSVNKRPPEPWILATLISIEPEAHGADRVLTLKQLETGLPQPGSEALILRTLPNSHEKKHRTYSGSNPPYLEANAADWLRQQGIKHLLLDLPSVDPEEDGGALAAHKAFWGLPDQPRLEATITEFVYVPNQLADGVYLLNLQIAAFENDAAPSRPLLFTIHPSNGNQS